MAAFKSSNSSNPFYSVENDDEVDDFEFLNNPKQGSGYMLGNGTSNQLSDADLKRQMLLEKKKELEESALSSTKSSLATMYESEQLGISTAEELIRQREQLQKAEDRVDEMNSNLTISQKHLNSIKSVFGGIKNWWGQKSKDGTMRPTEREAIPSSKLKAAMERSEMEAPSFRNDDEHPAFRVRGMLDDDSNYQQPSSVKVNDEIDKNLDELSVGIGRLKHLAIGLGDEIDDQDELLQRLDSKVDKADTRIYGQNREMARILKK